MQEAQFRAWLSKRKGQGPHSNAVGSVVSRAARVENAFGDFDAAYAKDRLQSILDILATVVENMRNGHDADERLRARGKLPSLGAVCDMPSAVKSYRAFKAGADPHCDL